MLNLNFPLKLASLLFLCSAAVALPPSLRADEPLPYRLVDPALKLVPIDIGVKESFVAVRADSSGRLFVGGREGLFVYEPDERGGYRPRRELYRFPEESWIYDIAIRGHDLYVMTASALYLLPEAVTRRDKLQARRILWGQPRGHIQLGFHALAWGPEGDLYLTMGDALQHYGDFNRPDHFGHWQLFGGPKNEPTPFTGSGAVLRCQPDGSGLQVVARGTFNCMALAFDRHWHLFSNDNDREAMPFRYVPARLLHVTPRADFGWPRGWMASKNPERSDLLETMYDGLGREAPVGLAYYDEPLFPSKYRQNLFLARWAQRAVTRLVLRPRGASFACTEEPFLVGREAARPLGLCVGRGGRVFLTMGHMPHLEGSPRYTSDLVMITTANDAPAHPVVGYDAATATAAKLWEELSQPSWQRRYQAHVEILRRGNPFLHEAVRRLAAMKKDDPANHHLCWLAAASGAPQAGSKLGELARRADGALRLQALRCLTEFPQLPRPRDLFRRALADADPAVQHAAVLAFFGQPGAIPKEIVVGPARSTDTYLRQAACLLLAEKAPLALLQHLCVADDPATRLAGVLATGFRLTLPPATAALDNCLPLDPYPDGACIIHFADAKLDLRRFGRVGNFTVAEHWKALPPTSQQQQLFAMLLGRLADKNERVRLQAAHFLSLLQDRRSDALVEKALAESEARRLEGAPVTMLRSVTSAWLAGPFADGAAGLGRVHPPQQGPVDLAAAYRQGQVDRAWKQVKALGGYFDFAKQMAMPDRASCYAYFVMESGLTQSLMLFVGSNDGVKVWHNGRLAWENRVVRRALMYNDMVLLRLQPGSNHILVRVHNAEGDSGLFINYKALGPVAPVLPDKVDLGLLGQRLKAAATGPQPTQIPEAFLNVNWPQVIKQGKRATGKELFDRLTCSKCHAVEPDQAGSVGPSLAQAGLRFTVPQLVESILLPSRQVSPVFRQTQIETKDGLVLAGLVVGETAEKVDLVLPDGSRQTINKPRIAQRRLQDISPMPAGLVRTPEELRDLLAYLLGK